MQNICLMLVGGQSRRDANFKSCINSYAESWDGFKFSIRCVHFQNVYCTVTNNREEIAIVVDSAKRYREYLSILNPIFYEQYAYNYLRVTPISPRKFAFSLVLTGFIYSQSNYRHYMQRCYWLSSLVYQNVDWSMIQEHINKMLASSYYQGNEPVKSVGYYRRALENIKQDDTVERQVPLIKEAFTVIGQVQDLKNSGALSSEDLNAFYEEMYKLEMPKVEEEGFDITLKDDYFNYINEAKTNNVLAQGISSQEIMLNRDSEQLWFNLGKRLEMAIQSVTNLTRLKENDEIILKIFDCIYVSDKNLLLKGNARESYTGEEIIITVLIENPFKIALDVKELRLEYEIEPFGATEASEVESLESKRETFTIAEMERKFIEFRIVPEKEGILKIKAVHWILDCIEGRHFFKFQPPVVSGKSTKRVFAINEIKITTRQPKPKFTLNNWKPLLFFGELNKMTLDVQNIANEDIDHFWIANPYSEAFSFESKKFGGVPASESRDFPLVIRGSIPGITEMRLLIKVFFKSGKTRFARIVFPIEVRNSFVPKYFTTPCFDERAVGLQFDEIWTYNPYNQGKSSQPAPKVNTGLAIDNVIILVLLGDKFKFDRKDPRKKLYRKEDNILYFYLELNNLKSDPKNLKTDLKENTLSFTGKEVLLEADTLQDFYHLTYQQYLRFQKYPSNYDPNETASIAIFWSFGAEPDCLRGVHFMYKVPLNLKFFNNPILQKKPLQEIPIQYQIVVPKKVTHNFDGMPFCNVEVTLHMTSIIGNKTVNSDHPLNDREILGSKYFVWEGILEQDVSELAPYETKTFTMKAVFFEKGVYDVSRFRFNFHFNRKTRELLKPSAYKENPHAPHIEIVTFSSYEDQCLIEISQL